MASGSKRCHRVGFRVGVWSIESWAITSVSGRCIEIAPGGIVQVKVCITGWGIGASSSKRRTGDGVGLSSASGCGRRKRCQAAPSASWRVWIAAGREGEFSGVTVQVASERIAKGSPVSVLVRKSARSGAFESVELHRFEFRGGRERGPGLINLALQLVDGRGRNRLAGRADAVEINGGHGGDGYFQFSFDQPL